MFLEFPCRLVLFLVMPVYLFIYVLLREKEMTNEIWENGVLEEAYLKNGYYAQRYVFCSINLK